MKYNIFFFFFWSVFVNIQTYSQIKKKYIYVEMYKYSNILISKYPKSKVAKMCSFNSQIQFSYKNIIIYVT